MSKEEGTHELGQVLDGLMKGRGLAWQRRQIGDARQAWVHAAGDDVAAHTRVRSLMDGVLWVDVDSAPLCHRLAAFEKDGLVATLKDALSSAHVTDIRFRLGAL